MPALSNDKFSREIRAAKETINAEIVVFSNPKNDEYTLTTAAKNLEDFALACRANPDLTDYVADRICSALNQERALGPESAACVRRSLLQALLPQELAYQCGIYGDSAGYLPSQSKNAPVAETLSRILKHDPSASVRIEAAKSAAYCLDNRVIESLIQVFTDTDNPELKRSTVETLGLSLSSIKTLSLENTEAFSGLLARLSAPGVSYIEKRNLISIFAGSAVAEHREAINNIIAGDINLATTTKDDAYQLRVCAMNDAISGINKAEVCFGNRAKPAARYCFPDLEDQAAELDRRKQGLHMAVTKVEIPSHETGQRGVISANGQILLDRAAQLKLQFDSELIPVRTTATSLFGNSLPSWLKWQ